MCAYLYAFISSFSIHILLGERFSHILTHIDERKQWDDQVKENYEIYPIDPTNDYCRLDNAVLLSFHCIALYHTPGIVLSG